MPYGDPSDQAAAIAHLSAQVAKLRKANDAKQREIDKLGRIKRQRDQIADENSSLRAKLGYL